MQLIGAKPCIMCGCDVVYHVDNFPNLDLGFVDVKYRIMCPKCKRKVICRGPVNNAIAAWNKLNEEKPKEGNYMNIQNDMDRMALAIVKRYIDAHLDASDEPLNYSMFTVWKAKILQNFKFLISTSIHDGMYYEVTYNGDKNEWYLDAYKKFENRCYSNLDVTTA